MFDMNEIQRRAEPQSLARGLALYKQNKVKNLKLQEQTVSATVTGQSRYQVSLTLAGDIIRNHCTCPAAEYQDFCKHCVAVAMSAIHDITPQEDKQVKIEKVLPEKPDKVDQLRAFLQEKSADELIEILVDYIQQDDTEWQKWQHAIALAHKAPEAREVRKMITQALPNRSIWGWKEVGGYFNRAETLFETIFQVMEHLKLNDQWKLAQHSLSRLNKVLDKIDDSGGYRFTLEEMISVRLISLFHQLDWSDEQKAQWLFEHLYTPDMDLFPPVPEAFEPSEIVEQRLLEKCDQHLQTLCEHRPETQETLYPYQSQLRSYSAPLIQKAKRENHWREECRLLGMISQNCKDRLRICYICLENDDAFDAEDWLLKARKLCQNDYEKQECQQAEIRVQVALDNPEKAWQIAWNLFKSTPNFNRFKALQALEEEIGVQDPNLIDHVEEQLLQACRPSQTGHRLFVSPQLINQVADFYLELNRVEQALDWTKQHSISHHNQIRLANHLLKDQPDESIRLYRQVLEATIQQTNNKAYEEAIKLLKQLDRQLKSLQTDFNPLPELVADMRRQYKQKRNMMKLLNQYFPQ